MAGTKSFERFCRLCAEEQDVTIMLFSPEAKDMLLIQKLQKFLHIEIDENNKLSKNICITCCSTLHILCDFVELVRKAQDTLCLKVNKQTNPTSTKQTIEKENDEPPEYEVACIDPRPQNDRKETNILLNYLSSHIKKIKEGESETLLGELPHTDQENKATITLIKNKQDDQNTSEQSKCKKRFSCNVCKKSFLLEQLLKNHSCQRSFSLNKDLEKHIKYAHKPMGYKYNCNFCGRRFKTAFSHASHMHIHKETARAHSCQICGRFYSNLASLKVHNISHSTEKPFKCSICEKGFKRKQELKFHMNFHTGAKPYKCKYCDKCFASSGNLYSHKNRIHGNHDSFKLKRQDNTSQKGTDQKKRFKCTICLKECDREENYTYHMFLHTREKAFHCILCNQKFITKRSLLNHYSRTHPSVKKPRIHTPFFCPITSKWVYK